ncbi:MAG TPA: stalk domain-containing protein [Symbiobacteriaceae bacterium]|jgi:hypothetical protein
MIKKRWWIPLLVLLLVAAVAVPATAGVLTTGTYTYILKGHELDVPVDILSIQGDVLVPEELLTALGVAPVVDGDIIHLRRGPVDAQLTVGGDTATVEGRKETLKAAPMQVSGRLFIPADVLPDLGLSLTVDGKFVLLRDYGPAEDVPGNLAQDVYDRLWSSHTVKGSVRTGDGVPVGVTITSLTDKLLRDQRLVMPWGTRLKLLSLLESKTLFLTSVRNDSFKSITLDPAKLLVTDEFGHQYDYQKTEIAVDGVVTAAMAPGAIRTSVLVYDKSVNPLTLFYDTGSAPLGKVSGP